MKNAFMLAALFFLCASTQCQEPDCRVKYAVVFSDPELGQADAPLPQWLDQRIKAEFPGFCQTREHDPDAWVIRVHRSLSSSRLILRLMRGTRELEFDSFSALSQEELYQKAAESGLSLVNSLFLPVDVPKNPGCKATFNVKWDAFVDWENKVGMTPSQLDWWLKKGRKRFPGLCYSADKPADWVIWMSNNNLVFQYTVNKPLVMQQSGTVSGRASGTVTDNSGDTTIYSGSGTATYSGTIYGPNVPVTETARQTNVAFGVKEGGAYRKFGFFAQSGATGLFEGKYMTDGPYRKALEDALKYIYRQPSDP